MAATLTYQAGGVAITGALTGAETVVVGNGGPQITYVTTQQIANLAAQVETITVVAAAGTTQGTATAIPAAAVVVSVTVTTSSEGVKLPTASTGKQVKILPPTTKGVQVYGGKAGQLINTATTATTAFAMASGQPLDFQAVDATHWRVSGPYSLTRSGLITASAGLTATQTLKGGAITVAAAGATQGTATAIAATAVVVNVTTTTSAEGVKLPTASTGRMIFIDGGTGKLFKVYGGAAGQSINAGTTATTAFVMASLKPCLFLGISATKWTVIKSA